MLNITCWSKREIGVLVVRLGGFVPSIARVLSSLIVYPRNFVKVDGGKWAFKSVCVREVWGYLDVIVE